MHKNNKCLFLIVLANHYNFQLSCGCSHLQGYWDHAHRHGKLEMLTFERINYMQEMGCHYLDCWSVQR